MKNWTRDNTFIQVVQLVSKVLGQPIEGIDESSGLYRTIGWDSLGHLQIVLALEDLLQQSVSNEEVECILTVHKIVEYILQEQKTRGGNSG